MSHEVQLADPTKLISRVAENFHTPSIRTVNGYLNLTTILNNELVVKIPQDTEPMRLQGLRQEWEALTYMQKVDVSPLAIPKPIEYSENPAYLIATYVPGETLTYDEIRALPKKTYERLGRDLGGYMAQQIVSAENYDKGMGAPAAAYGWPSIFEDYIGGFSDPRYPVLSSLTERLYSQWLEYRREIGAQALKVIHGDLTPGNMTLVDGKLHGIIDFGRLHLGEVVDDLSCLADVGPSFVAFCVAELQRNNIHVDARSVVLWRELKDLQVLPYWIRANNTGHPNFQATKEIISKRYSDLNWDELF